MWGDFNFLRLTDRQLTDGQNRLLNPASRMRAQGNDVHEFLPETSRPVIRLAEIMPGIIKE